MLPFRPAMVLPVVILAWSLACSGGTPEAPRPPSREVQATEALGMITSVRTAIDELPEGCAALSPTDRQRPLGDVIAELDREADTRQGVCEGAEAQRCQLRLQKRKGEDPWVATIRFQAEDARPVPTTIACEFAR